MMCSLSKVRQIVYNLENFNPMKTTLSVCNVYSQGNTHFCVLKRETGVCKPLLDVSEHDRSDSCTPSQQLHI